MWIRTTMASFQTLGRALMLPIAVLPVAGLLLRLGQPDLLDIPFVAAAGQSLFANLGLLFAIGVAIGFARNNDGAAGLSGVVCYFVTTFGARVFVDVPVEVLEGSQLYRDLLIEQYRGQMLDRISVPIGILSGIIAGMLFNRFGTIKLPDYLAFFGGRRFVPIAAAMVGMLLALLIGISISPITAGIETLSTAVVDAGGFGLFVYGVLNRLLIVTGLHHILNNVAWFVLGEFNGATGDLNRFFAGDPTAGGFMSGFFPIMMFGLPAACLAMYQTAPKKHRKMIGGMYASMALTSFLTGVTEPIEFAFMFQAPLLYLVHAVLTGLSMVLMDVLDVKLGFGFSAGLFDYLINYSAAAKPLLLLPVGIFYAGVYYLIFRWLGKHLSLDLPKAEKPGAAPDPGDKIQALVRSLGGASNIRQIGACTTRLRLEIDNRQAVDETGLRTFGAKAVLWPAKNSLQVILGPQADNVAEELRAAVKQSANAPTQQPDTPAPLTIEPVSAAALSALGGRANIKSVALGTNQRLMIELIRPMDMPVSIPGCIPVLSTNAATKFLHYFVDDPEEVRSTFAISKSGTAP